MTSERPECGRCGTTDRNADVRLWWVNLVREARLDGRRHDGAPFTNEYRCQACRDAVRPPRENK